MLRDMVEGRTAGPYNPKDVHFYNADCNDVLLSQVFPRIRYEDFRRGLCLLDPFGLHLDWKVIQTAGEMRSIEIFLNFPIHDMNRNVLHRDPTQVDPAQVRRMTRYWGDESWREDCYSSHGSLFGIEEKQGNETVVGAFVKRLKKVAGFGYVPAPMPMRNTKGATVYYLIFASQRPVAAKIVRDIFEKHGRRAS